MRFPRSALLAAAVVLAGCEGLILGPTGPGALGEGGGSASVAGGGVGGIFGGSSGAAGGGTASAAGGGSTGVVVPPGCDVAAYRGMTLEQISAQYESQVHPLFTRASGGCVSCHAPAQKRLFTVHDDADQTFFEASQAGYFKSKPGSLVDRLTSMDPGAVMPKGMAKWAQDDVDAVGRISCALAAYELSGVVPADETFPPQLLQPYTGPKVTSYDNGFLLFPQLKSKVQAAFGDSWVRTGADGGSVDLFAQNVGLFGGVDYKTRFTEARAATPEFLLGLDKLAPDVCDRAATAGTGPFAGLNLTVAVTDVPASSTRAYEGEADAGLTVIPTTAGNKQATGFKLFSNGQLLVQPNLPAGSYQVRVRARPDVDSAGNGPKLDIKFGGVSAGTMVFTDTTQVTEQTTAAFTVATSGTIAVSVAFTNDSADPPLPPAPAGDRNILVDRFDVIGPLGAGTGTARELAAKASLGTLYTRLLFHAPSATESTNAYALLRDLANLGAVRDAWSGVCQALVRHPDFLFTLPPAFDTATGAAKTQLLAVDLALRLVGRPPTAAELTTAQGTNGLETLADQYLKSPAFRDWYFERMRLRLESLGTDVTDEPARLWTYLATTGTPFHELLDGDYAVNAQFQKVPRPAEHGKTGLLTMKGFISNKPGLPHYNYAARVFTDFMGTIFEVPPEVFDQRGTATAASTVDPTSICFSCHQNLTPLSHQRLRWDDEGNYRVKDENGADLDDSDRGLVPSYAFKGQGLASFAESAVKKEVFVRRMVNAQYRLLMGRELRVAEDERELYKQLWDVTQTSNGNLQSVIKTIVGSRRYQRLP